MKAFLKKEGLEWVRSGRLFILSMIFIVFGIMNPAIAKMTPWLMKTMSDSLAESGITTTEITVNALSSWGQFYKNLPMALIVFVLMCSNIFTKEYEKGTLIPLVVKGLGKKAIFWAKSCLILVNWTVLYFLCFGITNWYNGYFWDNTLAKNLSWGIVFYWLFGLFVLSLVILFSTGKNNTWVIIGTGVVIFSLYLLSLFEKIAQYLPLKLAEGMAIFKGAALKTYEKSLVITLILIVICLFLGQLIFQKKKL